MGHAFLLRPGFAGQASGLTSIIAIISAAEQLTTKERLLEAAAKVIARDGFQGARLADVAREAGLTTGAIYSNFRDKQELFLAAFDRVQQLSQNLADEGDLERMIENVPGSIRQFAESGELQILNLELMLLGTRDPALRKYLGEGERDSIENVANRLPAHLPDRRERAALILALMNGLAVMRMVGGDNVPLDGVVPVLRRLAGLES